MNIHSAPSVVYPLGRSRFHFIFLLALWLAGVFCTMLWFGAMHQLDWRAALALVSILISGFAACKSWQETPVGFLLWDGDVWHWESKNTYHMSTAEQALSIIADFQHKLLLRLDSANHAKLWLWAERNAQPERWLDLRRALYSPGKSTHSSRTIQPAVPSPSAAASATHPHCKKSSVAIHEH